MGISTCTNIRVDSGHIACFLMHIWYIKRTLLYSAVSSLWDCSKHFTLHPLADLFIPTPICLLWEAFSHAAITVQRLIVHISALSLARYSFIQLGELWQRGMNESLETAARQFEHGFSQLRARRSSRYAITLYILVDNIREIILRYPKLCTNSKCFI